MADQDKSNTSPVMAFIVGGVVIAVAVLAYFLFSGGEPATGGGGDTNCRDDSGSGEGSGDSEGRDRRRGRERVDR